MADERGFTDLSLVPVPDEMDGVTIELVLESGFVVQGWMTRRFMGRTPQLFTWDPLPADMLPQELWGAPGPTCISHLAQGWRASEAGHG